MKMAKTEIKERNIEHKKKKTNMGQSQYSKFKGNRKSKKSKGQG